MPPPPIQRPRARPTTGLWIAVIVLAVALLISLVIHVSSAATKAFQQGEFAGGGGADEYPVFMETWSYGHGPATAKVVRIPLDGIIMRRQVGGLFASRIDRVQEVIHQVRAATNDDDIRGIVLEVNSPGGAITPSDEIYKALQDFRQSRDDRIVVAFARDLVASGGYYCAIASDWIIAEPTSIVGSIGVIMQALNWKQFMDDIGIRDVTIASGENKDLLNPFKEPPEAQIELLQEVIDSMHGRFKQLVSDARKIDMETLDTLADGRIFTADQALDHGLINQVGYWEDVAERTAELLNQETVSFVRYSRQVDLFTLLTQVRVPVQVRVDTPWDTSLGEYQPMYMWRP